MSEFVEIPGATPPAPGCALTTSVAGRRIALFNLGGTLYALDDECPHSGGPLGGGMVQGDRVACPWHMWLFDIKTGLGPFGGSVRVDTFAVKQENGKVLVDLTPQPRSPRPTSGVL